MYSSLTTVAEGVNNVLVLKPESTMVLDDDTDDVGDEDGSGRSRVVFRLLELSKYTVNNVR